MCFETVRRFEKNDSQKLAHSEIAPWSSHMLGDAAAWREARKLLTPEPDEPEPNSIVIRRPDERHPWTLCPLPSQAADRRSGSQAGQPVAKSLIIAPAARQSYCDAGLGLFSRPQVED